MSFPPPYGLEQAIHDILPKVRTEVSQENFRNEAAKRSYMGLLWTALKAKNPAHLDRKGYGALALTMAVAAPIRFVLGILRVLSGWSFWQKGKPLAEKAVQWLRDLANVALFPLTFPINEIAATAGIISPKAVNRMMNKAFVIQTLPDRRGLIDIVAKTLAEPGINSSRCLDGIRWLQFRYTDEAFSTINAAYAEGIKDVKKLAQIVEPPSPTI